MYQEHSGDLFATQTSNTPTAPPSARSEEAKARIVRARNAALQKPLSYLDVRRNVLENEDTKLFEHINPIQVAQYFLEKVSDSMIFGNGVSRIEIRRNVQDYVAALDFEKALSTEQHEIIVSKVIDALRNAHNDNLKFKELIRNEVTGETEEFVFELVSLKHAAIDGREDTVFQLTQQGVKLLHINWQAPDDFDMYAVMVESAIRGGKYTDAALHVERCLRSSTRIEAALNDIYTKLENTTYEKDFEDISALIKEVEQDNKAFGLVSGSLSSLIRTSRDTDDIDDETRRVLNLIHHNVEKLNRIHSHFTLKIDRVIKAFRRNNDIKVESLGVKLSVPDIRTDIMLYLGKMPVAVAQASKMSDTLLAALMPARTTSIFDPFTLFERMIDPNETDDDFVEEDDIVLISKIEGTSLREANTARNFARSVLRKFGRRGIRLSEMFLIMEKTQKFDVRMRYITAHRIILLSQLFDDMKILKIQDNSQLSACPYASGPDLLFKVISND